MGAEYFTAYHDGTDVKQAFRDAVEHAEYESGHGGYTGTIAEKDEYKVVTETPMTLNEAEKLAAKLSESDDELADKWGPAGAIPVHTDRRTVRVTIPERANHGRGFKTTKEAATAALEQAGVLREGESQVPSTQGVYIQGVYKRHPRTDYVIGGELEIPVEGGGPLEHRGWLFFGFASY
ncbi:hypothetical protein HUT19_42150 (plasmid) [Streptomyces sp. NA02950]|uniref:hypothetical protein n=1 Tax=Streptomyces sp. NA02950 TaxID=2742137 RepID=UPI00158FFD81|nr:hypothetical protein [Streptomyces sp. NA02950]QKV98321.1 hypothetical protein HUT19_42150 [Streptomyces sp. NA02950]